MVGSSNPKDIVPNYNKYDWRKDFSGLDDWKKCRRLKLFFYQNVIPNLPVDEKYNLSIQIRKASISMTANIAEGYGRYHYQEGIQFYRISRASLYELKDHLISCYDLKYISKEIYVEGTQLIELAKKILNGFIRFTQQKIKNK